MSSMPFNLGLPVVDFPPLMSGQYVLRSRDERLSKTKIKRLQEMLTDKDLILVEPIGMRPDKPVPVSMHFVEIKIKMGEADTQNGISFYQTAVTGKRKSVMIYDD